MYRLVVEKYFSSAHRLRDYEGKCEILHGHNYRVNLSLEGEELNSIGLLIDFKEVKALLDKLLGELDHRLLNEHPYFQKENPSAENIARFLYQQVSKNLPSGVKVSEVRVWESDGCGASYLEK